MRTAIFGLLAALVLPTAVLADEGRTPAPKGARVFIIEPKDGATVASPVTVKFGIEGMALAPAGTDTPNTGHHHLLIDTTVTDFTSAIAKDENHVHYGKAQTEASVGLKPGPHTLQLLLGDKNHMPHDPPILSDVVHITVE